MKFYIHERYDLNTRFVKKLNLSINDFSPIKRFKPKIIV